ncbi:MAG: hypothetical protein ACO1SX_18295 [Actinomycetota bacterium]
MESYAFIGTKQPKSLPRTWCQLFTAAAEDAARNGITVHTGATPGAEQLAAERTLQAGGAVRLYLPWPGFEAVWVKGLSGAYPGRVSTVSFDPEVHSEWTEAIYAWHPNGEHLARASLAIYARNYGLVREATTVVALPYLRVKNGAADKGQSEQGLEVARSLGLPVYDLSEEEDRQALRDLLDLP